MKLLRTLWDGLRAIALRPPRVNPVEINPDTFIALIAIYFGVALALAMIEVQRPWTFVPDGVTTVLTDSLLTLASAWLVMRVMKRD